MKKKYPRLLLIVTFIIFVALLVSNVSNASWQEQTGLVIEGESLEGIRVGKSSVDDVIAYYGNDYKIIKHGVYSYEMVYKSQGLSFYSCQDDPNKEVFVIEINKPYQATTLKGAILGESTLADILRMYGEDEVSIEGNAYSFPGIQFYFDEQVDGDGIKPEQEIATQETKVAEKVETENNTPTFIIDDEEVFETRTGELNPANNIENSNESAETTDDSEDKYENKGENLDKSKILKAIDLIEKDGVRQCDTKFEKRNNNEQQ